MAVQFNVDAVLDELQTERRVFHSEADFQFAFAWSAKRLFGNFEVRLETHPVSAPHLRLDLLLTDPVNDETIAIELKYLTRFWEGVDGAETFALRAHSALDLRRYDFVKDISRIEEFIRNRGGWRGYAIVLTNEPSYWKVPAIQPKSLDSAFRIHEGAQLEGRREWAAITASSRGRSTVFDLAGTYRMHW